MIKQVEAALSERFPAAGISVCEYDDGWGAIEINFQGLYLVIEWAADGSDQLTLYQPPMPAEFTCNDTYNMVSYVSKVLTG